MIPFPALMLVAVYIHISYIYIYTYHNNNNMYIPLGLEGVRLGFRACRIRPGMKSLTYISQDEEHDVKVPAWGQSEPDASAVWIPMPSA